MHICLGNVASLCLDIRLPQHNVISYSHLRTQDNCFRAYHISQTENDSLGFRVVKSLGAMIRIIETRLIETEVKQMQIW